MKNIYIIGNKEYQATLFYRREFSWVQLRLEFLGFNVVNPLDIAKSDCFITKSDLRKLIESDSVYIMSNVSLGNVGNVEVRISLCLGLYVINGYVSDFFSECTVENSNK